MRNFARVVRESMQLFILLAFAAPVHAFAYVDPGSGSVIVTTILGLIAAVGYTFRKWFYNLRSKIGDKSGQSGEDGRR